MKFKSAKLKGHTMSEKSQFSLLVSKRLGPLFVTQAFGAFNDSVYKQAFNLILVFGILAQSDLDADLLTNLAAGIFILPYFLFSATAGGIADRFEKSALIRKIKIAEICIVILISISIHVESLAAMYVMLFLLGTQSTFFGPLKFSILPQHLTSEQLVGGNAIIEMGTFVAILSGTLVGGVLAGLDGVKLWVSVVLICCALAGYLSSLTISKAPPAKKIEKSNWNPLTETVSLIRIARENLGVFRSILGISWFWLIGSIYLVQIANLTNLHLFGEESVVTLLLSVFTISIAFGSLFCERLSRHRVEIGLVPIAAVGITAAGIDGYFAIEAIQQTDPRNALEFVNGDGSIRLLIDMFLMGFFAGLYVVPLQSFIQSRTELAKRARVIAANNVLNSIFMIVGSLASVVWLTILDYSIPSLLLFVAIVNILVSAYIFYTVPEFAMRFIIWIVGHTVYRIRHEGLEHIPDSGPALIVCNHVARIDALILAGAVRRPIRFVMYKPIYEWPILNFVFRVGGAIPINSKEEDPKSYEEAFEAISEGLRQRDLICIFPEGKLSTDGEIDQFKAGVDKIIARDPVPVIPMALRGLWGSYFSRMDKKITKGTRKFWDPIFVAATEPVEPEKVSASQLEQIVKDLRGALQ